MSMNKGIPSRGVPRCRPLLYLLLAIGLLTTCRPEAPEPAQFLLVGDLKATFVYKERLSKYFLPDIYVVGEPGSPLLEDRPVDENGILEVKGHRFSEYYSTGVSYRAADELRAALR
jgi:hypothetical protein